MVVTALLIGILTVTSYRAVPEQTKPGCTSRNNCHTSIDDGLTKFGVAVSQDLLAKGVVHYGDIVYIPGYGYRVINDCMGLKNKQAIDLFVFTKAQEKAVGTRHLKVYLVKGEL